MHKCTDNGWEKRVLFLPVCFTNNTTIPQKEREKKIKKRGLKRVWMKTMDYLMEHRFCWYQVLIHKVKGRFLLEHHASIYHLQYFLCWILVQIINLLAVKLIKIFELIVCNAIYLKTASMILKSTPDISAARGPSVWLVHWKMLQCVIKSWILSFQLEIKLHLWWKKSDIHLMPGASFVLKDLY